VGITGVIAGDCELNDAIQETEVDNLFALTCGPKPANPSEILSSQRFSELLSILRDKFDYVIVDTPPIMAVTDPAVVAPRVDGLLLAVRIGNRSRQDCGRTAEILNNVGANIVGVIVNGVDQKERYGYGYSGKYGAADGPGPGSRGYSYGYTIGNPYDDRYSAYYTDEEDEDELPPPPRKRLGNSLPPASA
jgi:capsular exopolysaccharide synthesis family protein